MRVNQYALQSPRTHHSCCSLTDTSEEGPAEEEEGPKQKATALQRLTSDMCRDERIIKELVIGRRVGFYNVRGEIGYGTFSRVKMAFHALTKDKVALKVLNKARMDPTAQRLLHKEIQCLESLHHPNVARLYEVVDTPTRLYLVLEYAGGGDLSNHIYTHGKLCDHFSKITFSQILAAVKYMHSQNIVHRDLKAENVLFTLSGCVKVADLGFSTRLSARHQLLETQCGSPPYAAPELFQDQPYLGPAVDVWAMGVLLFFMVTGNMPFRAETMGKLRRCVLSAEYELPRWVPGPCQRLIRGILKPSPADRYALDQMLGCDWLLPVEFPWAFGTADNSGATLEENVEAEEEVRAAMIALGFTEQQLRINPVSDSRSPVEGVYRILLHRSELARGADTLPMVTGVVRDPKREGLRAYRGLRHTSKFCAIA
ncbi:serine/threonine-protein kinase NIM1-like [Eucyclogobius newberryi]|uniref:serine/threonine-protein kinase NIM1-like n=1 Tax=Eucyclogobius newberryi TaxID=166745 RepID=UPI003B5AB689